MLAQFPRCQTGTLVARAGFIDPHVQVNARVKSGVDWCSSRAVVDKRQPTGVAMGQDVDALTMLALGKIGNQCLAVLANTTAMRSVFVGQRQRRLLGHLAHLAR